MTYAEEKELVTEVMDDIYETFVISLWLAGYIEDVNFWEKKETYFRHEWVAAPKRWIDPQKEANANKTALQTGVRTYKQIAAEQGRDWRDQIDDMAEVLEYAKAKGIDLGGVIFGQKKEELYESDEEDETVEEPETGADTADGDESGDDENDGDDDGSDGDDGKEPDEDDDEDADS
jgi:capsid protein